MATEVVKKYMDALNTGHYDIAWRFLAQETQRAYGSPKKFASDKDAFLRKAGHRYVVEPARNNAAEIASWRPEVNAPGANLARAFLVDVDFPVLAGRNTAKETLLFAPDASGKFLIWEPR